MINLSPKDWMTEPQTMDKCMSNRIEQGYSRREQDSSVPLYSFSSLRYIIRQVETSWNTWLALVHEAIVLLTISH